MFIDPVNPVEPVKKVFLISAKKWQKITCELLTWKGQNQKHDMIHTENSNMSFRPTYREKKSFTSRNDSLSMDSRT